LVVDVERLELEVSCGDKREPRVVERNGDQRRPVAAVSLVAISGGRWAYAPSLVEKLTTMRYDGE